MVPCLNHGTIFRIVGINKWWEYTYIIIILSRSFVNRWYALIAIIYNIILKHYWNSMLVFNFLKIKAEETTLKTNQFWGISCTLRNYKFLKSSRVRLHIHTFIMCCISVALICLQLFKRIMLKCWRTGPADLPVSLPGAGHIGRCFLWKLIEFPYYY